MTEETPTKNLFQKKVDGQKTKKKNGILKGQKKGKPGKKTEKEEKSEVFKQALRGNKKTKNL